MEINRPNNSPETQTEPRGPRLGFLGLGWIGRNRLEALLGLSSARVMGLCDVSTEALEAARAVAPDARVYGSLDEMLDHESLDGVVIATPSALHAAQTERCLERGLAVFCQKPLGRTAAETKRVVEAAENANRLLGVDFCYRHVTGVPEVRRRVHEGEIGRVFHVEAVFHNAYGPGNDWFFDSDKSGGGCLMDLGIHLVDLLLWVMDRPRVDELAGRLYVKGKRLSDRRSEVEDFAAVQIAFDGDVTAHVACSWNLSIGRDAEIAFRFHGTDGSLVVQNVDGSYYDFLVTHHRSRSSQVIAEPPDDWGGRAIAAWADALAAGSGFQPAIRAAVTVAEILDGIYEGATSPRTLTGEERTSWQENPEPQPITIPSDRGQSVAEAFPSK